MSDNNNKPTHLFILKVVGFIGIFVAIVGFVLTFKGFGDFEHNYFMIGGFMATMGGFVGVSCLIFGFRPEMMKLSTKTAKYIQEENKEDLADIADTGAEIMSGAVKKTAKAVKEGLKDTKFCKYCGAEIDEDSIFCSKCGKEQ